MTIREFQQFSEIEKLSIIMESGILMTQHVQQDQRIFVYSLETFYASAAYSVSDDSLVCIDSFIQINQLIPEYRRQLIAVNPAERAYVMPEM